MMHLTNYSINKKNQDFVKFVQTQILNYTRTDTCITTGMSLLFHRNEDPDVEDHGNKWTLGALLRFVRRSDINS